MKIIICRGIPGSGKSYYAKQWVEEKPESRIRINNDDIRSMLGPYWVPSRESLVNTTRRHLIAEAILHGYDIILDNTNLSDKYITEVRNILSGTDRSDLYDIIYKDFPTDVNECIRRDSKRERPIGEKVIREMYERVKNIIY